jgi:chemosensory pili system protein ChpA (sensor histidine kinase/response regulator)
VTVDTKPGAGTIFQLRLPVMLAVAQAFLVEAGGRRYAVPLADVDFVADRRQASLSRVGNAALVEVNDAVIPAIDLAHRLAGEADRLDEESGWLLITRSGGEPKAMRVDALFGQQEIVVKPLGRYLSSAPGVTGATILGDGEIALIIDVTEVTGKQTIAAPASHAAEPTPIDSRHAGPGTVLVVDDSLSVRRVLARTLERHGWTTLQAHDGVEALEMVQAGGIDIVITDIEMPRMDGFELINSLRRGGWQSLPVVVLTSRSSSKHRDKAIELGANAYIVKPFQEQELLQTLDRETSAIRVAG